MHRLLALTFALAAVAVAGCGSDDDAGATGGDAMGKEPAMKDTKAATAGGAMEDSATAAKRGTAIRVVDSQYGRILAARHGQAVYLFDKETSARSRCYGACAKAWPPVLTKGRPVAGKGAKATLLGTTRRRDGTKQVTYDGQPLYYYVADAPGRVLCHDVEEFGGTWLVLRATGKAVS
jgi:predicted lipoprotein with Yx(FWY)xxD motif